MTDIFIVWTIHPDRVNKRLTDLDIKTALAYFAERTGKEATAITLHPSVEKRLPAIPDGITVTYQYGVLAHEVFLPVPADLPKPPDAKQGAKDTCNINISKEIIQPITPLELCYIKKRGRPPFPPEVPVSRQTLWRRKKKLQGVLL